MALDCRGFASYWLELICGVGWIKLVEMKSMVSMQPFDAFSGGWKNFSDFTGKAKRPEFWWFMLVNSLCYAVLSVVWSQLAAIYSVVSIIPMVAVGIRRLRDTGRSGWWYLINFVPFLGTIVFLVFCAQPSKVSLWPV